MQNRIRCFPLRTSCLFGAAPVGDLRSKETRLVRVNFVHFAVMLGIILPVGLQSYERVRNSDFHCQKNNVYF